MRPTSAIERVWAWIIASAIVGLWVGISAYHGALGIPRNDDWSYLRVALDLAESGQVHLTGWVQMFFIGQAVLAQPLVAATSGSITALQIFVAAMGAASLVLAYDLVRRLLSPALAAFAVFPLALGPMFGSLAVSFMTDIPALFLSLATLSLGAEALRKVGRQQARLVLVTAFLGLLAFTIREYGLLAWIAVALTMLWSDRNANPRTRAIVVASLAASLITAVALWRWRSQIPGSLVTGFGSPESVDYLTQSLSVVCSALITLGICIAPAMCAIRPTRLLRGWGQSRWVVAGLSVVAWVLIAATARASFPLGSMLTDAGNYPDTIIGVREIPLLPGWVMVALGVLGTLSLIVATLVIIYPRAAPGSPGAAPVAAPCLSTQRLLTIYLVLTFLMLTGFAVLLDQLWDRYLLAAIPITAAVVLSRASRRGLVVSPTWAAVPVFAMTTFAVLGLAFADRAATLDGASWSVAQSAVAAGERADQIDGGFAWNGNSQSGQASWPAPAIPGQPWWRALYPEARFCTQVQVTSSPPATHSQQNGTLPTQVLQTQTLLGTRLWFTVVRNPALGTNSDTLPQC